MIGLKALLRCIKERIRQQGSEVLLLVERFLTNPKSPLKITSVVGKIFSQKEMEQINNDLNKFIIKAANYLTEKPSLNINEGDVVWDGEKAVILAIN